MVRDRETADHSIPYLVAAALLDGEVTERQFAPERIADPQTQLLMSRIDVREDPAMTARFPAAQPARIEADIGGAVVAVDVANSKGNAANPLSDAEIEAKFRALCEGRLARERAEGLLAALWGFEGVATASGVVP